MGGLARGPSRVERARRTLPSVHRLNYRPADAREGKIKKDQAGGELNLSLVRTTDVLTSLADRRRPGQLIVGFAAEHGDGALAYGREKLARKKLDAIVVNDIGRTDIGFEGAHNEVTIVTAAGERHVPRTSKAEVARAVLDTVRDLRIEPRTRA